MAEPSGPEEVGAAWVNWPSGSPTSTGSAYLDNLHRLGLVWFSREQLPDPMEYQVLEAQPAVSEALHSQRFTKVVRRSIHLTPFGDDICRAVLLEADDDADYPRHQVPEEAGDD